MPELPEVETVMRGMQARLEGRVIVRADVRRADLRWALPLGLQVRLTGATETGTFTVTGEVSFQSYGTIGSGLYGGKLLLNVLATPDAAPSLHFPATLTVVCLLGSPPAGAEEGIKFNVKDFINFNRTVPESGQTLFVLE